MQVLEFINDMEKEIPSICKFKNNCKNKKIEIDDESLKKIKKLLILWKNTQSETFVLNFIKDILKNPTINNGKIHEAIVYEWLSDKNINYKPQKQIKSEDCFKNNIDGYIADGVIIENNIVFDVKKFGISLPHIDTLREKLQSHMPKGYNITIKTNHIISNSEIRKMIEDSKELSRRILNEKNKINTDFLYIENNMEFRARLNMNNSLIQEYLHFDMYEFAATNEFYFLSHSSQFCSNTPYILFCPYNIESLFYINREEYIFLIFRTLCRRIFINLCKMEDREINEFDGKAKKDVSVACASRKISAIVFMDINNNELDSNMFVYQNPNADYKISRYQIETLFGSNTYIENFEFDNY